MSRLPLQHIDLSQVTSTAELHLVLRDALGFPYWYGCNWDAFWDAITGLVEMPEQLHISGLPALSRRLPRDAQLLLQCLERMKVQYPTLAADLLLEPAKP